MGLLLEELPKRPILPSNAPPNTGKSACRGRTCGDPKTAHREHGITVAYIATRAITETSSRFVRRVLGSYGRLGRHGGKCPHDAQELARGPIPLHHPEPPPTKRLEQRSRGRSIASHGLP